MVPHLRDETVFPMISALSMDISGTCNLKCAYCAEELTMPIRKPMSNKVIDESLNFFFKYAPTKGELSIHVGSGESLLYPDVVRQIGLKAKTIANKRNQPLTLHITTNGTLLTQEITKWLIAEDWNVKISLDGNEKIHDKYRKNQSGEGTFRVIEPFIRKLSHEIPDRFSTTSVLCSGTDPQEVFNFLESLGVKKIEMLPVAASEKAKVTLTKKDFAVYRRFISNYAYRIAMCEDLPIHIRFFNRLLNVMGYRNESLPCGAGRNFFAVDYTKSVFPCMRFAGLTEHQLGTLKSLNANELKLFHQTVGRPYQLRKECSKCWTAPLCGGPCYACAELIWQGSPQPSYCKIVKLESKAAIWLVDYLKNNNIEKLVNILMTNQRRV